MKVSQAIVDVLAAESTKFVTVITGNGNQHLHRTLLRDPQGIRLLVPRHERVGLDMADGYTRASGQSGVGLVCGGPGSAHAFAGIAQSFADNVPVLLLKGQVPTAKLGVKSLLEYPTVEPFREITKWAVVLNHPGRVTELFRLAFAALRNGKPGPVAVEIPLDIQDLEVPADAPAYRPVKRIRTTADPTDVQQAAELLATARSPYILAGAGVLQSEAWDELRALAEALSAPVATTLNGKSAFPENHPLSLGEGGYPRSAMSTPQALHYAQKADVVLGVGCSFMANHSQGPIPPGVKLIHVEIDAMASHQFRQPDIVLGGDARLVVTDLLSALGGTKREPDVERMADIRRRKEAWLAELTPHTASLEVPIDPYRVVGEVMRTVDRERTVVLHDAGLSRWQVAHPYEAIAPRTFIGMGGQSEMGYSLGAALGAKLARPDCLVVNLMGDGAFGMTGMDIETAVRYQIPILCIVLNNSSLGIELAGRDDPPLHQALSLGGNMAGVARELGAHAERVVDPDALGPALRRAIAATAEGRPAVLEVMVELHPIIRY
ncbi:MAG: hypothetical protein HYY04_15695 [Chloroflexi bacterium]|nr:hypothetical protein [Chloroflexota bacterium]